MPLSTEVGLSPGDFVLDVDTVLSSTRGRAPKFSAHIYCAQTAGCIKMPLGTEVNLGPGDVVLQMESQLPLKGAQPPSFRFMSIVAKRLHG